MLGGKSQANTNKRRHTAMPFHVPKCVCLLRWLSIASGMQIVFVRVPLCVHSLPMPGASQTWGVNRSLRMGFNDTGSSGRARFKAEAGRISSRTCVHSTRLCSHMHACDVPSSWINPPQIQRRFHFSLPRSCYQEETPRTMHVFGDFWYYKANVRRHKQTPGHEWVSCRGTLRAAIHQQSNYTHYSAGPHGCFKGFIWI